MGGAIEQMCYFGFRISQFPRGVRQTDKFGEFLGMLKEVKLGQTIRSAESRSLLRLRLNKIHANLN